MRPLVTCSLLAVLVVVLGGMNAAASTGAPSPSKRYYLVPTEEVLTSPVLPGVDVIETYPDRLFVSSEGDLPFADAVPLSYDIRMPNAVFDPLRGPPVIPAGMSTDWGAYRPSDDVYALLQFTAPVKNAWKTAASTHGIDLIYPESGFSYIAHGKKMAFEEFAREPYVRWVGPYHPYFKLRNGAEQALGPHTDTWRKFTVWVFAQSRAGLQEIKSGMRSLGADIYWEYDAGHWPYQMEFWGTWDMLPGIARMDGVYFIEPRGEFYILNDQASWVLQTFQNGLRSIFDHGVTGEGVILAVADTGVDQSHPNFQNQVVRYWDCADNTDGHGHGTHVSGTVMGDGGSQGTYDTSSYDGMAFGAKLSMQDIAVGGSIQCATPSQNAGEAKKDGAIVEQNSWGGTCDGSYGSSAQDADQFMWDNPDFLLSFSNGNSGSRQGTVCNPASAKSVLSVGASAKGGTKDMASFSSRGPTDDGRFKPTITAPGVNTMSAKAGGGYTQMSGTSMSGPAAAGMNGLTAQYFSEGWYPGGTKGSGPGFMPSAALMKAVEVNSGADQDGGNGAGGPFPNNDQGWGKIKLEDTLFFDGDARKLWVEDVYTNGKAGLTSGESRQFPLTVKAGEPLKVTLVWTDYPGNGLKNDLNLKVTAPGGTDYLGNVFSSGESQSGGSPDDKNVEEVVYLKSPSAGDYIIEVSAVSIGGGNEQKFALVASGDVEGGSGIMVSSPQGGAYKGGSTITVEWKSFGSVQDGTVSIEYTLDGSSWNSIATGKSKSGTMQWTVPYGNTSTAKIRISGKDSKGQTVSAESLPFTVDSGAPDTSAGPLPAYSLDRNIQVPFTERDNLAGVEKVELYYRVNNGSYQKDQESNATPFSFKASKDGRFDFYTVGIDKVGNLEAPPSSPDASTIVDTTPPAVSQVNPPKDAMGVSVLTTVSVVFSEPMDRASAEGAFKIAPGVPGKFTWTGSTLTFKPDSQLQLNTKYTVTIARTAKDPAGHLMKDNYTWSFTTTPNKPNPGNIEGHVYDALTDQPIEGVDVIAYFGSNYEVNRATTDTTGAYTIVDIDAGKYNLVATKFNYRPANKTVQSLGDHQTLSGVDFYLFSLGTNQGGLEVCTVDMHGVPLPDVSVWLGNATSTRQAGRTGSNGCLVLKPLDAGMYTVEVKKDGFTSNRTTGVSVAAAEITSIRITMDKAPFTWSDLIPWVQWIIILVVVLAAVGMAVRFATRTKCPACTFRYKKKLGECPVCGYSPGAPPGMVAPPPPPGMGAPPMGQPPPAWEQPPPPGYPPPPPGYPPP